GINLGPRPSLGYTESMMDRAADKRLDPAFLEAVERAPEAGAFAIVGELVVLRRTDSGLDPVFAPAEARMLGPVGETVFLGLADGAARFGMGLSREAAEALKARTDIQLTDLRSIAVEGLVTAEHLPPLAEAKAMLQWHARHRFCAAC